MFQKCDITFQRDSYSETAMQTDHKLFEYHDDKTVKVMTTNWICAQVSNPICFDLCQQPKT